MCGGAPSIPPPQAVVRPLPAPKPIDLLDSAKREKLAKKRRFGSPESTQNTSQGLGGGVLGLPGSAGGDLKA